MLNPMILGLCLLLLADTCSAKNQGNGKGHGKKQSAAPAATIRFAPEELRIIREYYGQHPVNLPPGLQKKYARTGQLPPGWQKKMRGFPMGIESRLPPPCSYCGRGVVDGYGVIYDKRTSIILDVVQLAADILR